MRKHLSPFILGIIVGVLLASGTAAVAKVATMVAVVTCTPQANFACIGMPGTSTGIAIIRTKPDAGNPVLELPTESGTLATEEKVAAMIAAALGAPPPSPTPTPSPTATPTPTPPPVGNSASFVRTDTTTKGSWQGVFGSEGYSVFSDATSFPAYAQISTTGQTNYIWTPSTTDVRATHKVSASDRIAATMYTATSMTMDVNISDGRSHQISIYNLDWDVKNRLQSIDILDAATNAVLDTRNISAFSGGNYLVWNIAGHVKVRLTRNPSSPTTNAVISGWFFDPAP